jgi:spermidine/putrescine ABC transporter ATP-binding subunit
MVSVRLENISKQFGSVLAVDDVSLDVKEGEFFTLLGPSGCGKTTTLRMVAGFYKPDGGTIHFNHTVINDIPPHKRDTGMVFQNYALWPHMDIFSNVAFGLQMRKIPREEMRRRVLHILDLVGMKGMENRNPGQLSGGQQQRVALARALVIEPQVLLLDEPLSNLDAKLRVDMRREIRRIQQDLAITSIYVTHDQEESLSISNRIAVMNEGRLVQVGAPRQIYESPANKFVAEFIGSTNFIKGTITTLDDLRATLDTEYGIVVAYKEKNQDLKEKQEVLCSVRPEGIQVGPKTQDKGQSNTIFGQIEQLTYLGESVRYQILVDETGRIFNASIQNIGGTTVFEIGEKVTMTFSDENIRVIPI